jgi:hypothetical protein
VSTETATNYLILLNSKLENTADAAGDKALKTLSNSCNAVAAELLGALEKLKVQGEPGKWKSMRKALRSV